MYARIVSFGVVIPLATLAGALHLESSRFQEFIRRSAATTYSLQANTSGSAFFSDFYFFTGTDPTGGNVNYVNQSVAQQDGLAYVDGNGRFVMQVDSWSNVNSGGNRNSVRIQSDNQYTAGLFILDALAMPEGCGVWPSFWTNGPNWPQGGEIDIVEGINNQAKNQMTLHSAGACTIDKQDTFSGQILNTNCQSNSTSDSGCSIMDSSTTSFSSGFNEVSGGVFAFLWDTSAGMSMWHFTRSNIPADINDGSPTPANWGTPGGFWSSATCDIANNFYDHTIIFDITLCGGWAGSAYGNSKCPGTCANMVANATNFDNAKWVVNYVAVYQ